MRIVAVCVLVVLGSCADPINRGGGGGPVAPAFVQEPAQNPSWGVDKNDNPRSLLLHSGEYVLKRVDMAIRARRLGFRFRRVWRSMNTRVTPLGVGWDANVFQRLEFLSGVAGAEGTIRHHDGTGRFDDYAGGVAVGRFAVLRTNPNATFTLREPNGHKRHFDATGRITSEVDRIGNTRSYAYDPEGRLVSVADDMGREVTFTYDAAGRLATMTDFTDREVRYQYTEDGRLIEVRSPIISGTPTGNDFPNGRRETYTYDAAGNIATIVSPNENEDGSGTPTQTIVYDNFRRVTRTTVGGTNASGRAAGGTLMYEYLEGGGLKVTDRNGNVTCYEFDGAGRTTRVDDQGFVTTYEYDVDGNLTRKALPEGNVETYEYDRASPSRFHHGNVLRATRLPGPRAADQASLVTTYEYDPLYSRIASRTSARGNDATYVPQNGGATSAERYTARWVFDYQEGSSAPPEAVEYGIDVSGAIGRGDVNGDGATDQAQGNAVRLDRPTVTLLAGSNQADAEGGTAQPVTWRWTYNAFGQRVTEEDPRGNTRTLEYFAEQDPDGDGNDITPGRDATTGGYLRRVIRDAIAGPRRRDPGAPAAIENTYGYDARGNLIARTDGRGFTYSWTINAADEPIQVERPKVDGDQATGYLTHIRYDANGNVVRYDVEDVKTDPVTRKPTAGGTFFQHRFKWDILDRLIESDLDATRDAALPVSVLLERLVTLFGYDANENLISVTKPEGNRDTYAFDARDLHIRTTRGEGSPDASTWRWDHDGNGNRISWTDGDGDVEVRTFDAYDRLVRVTDREGNEFETSYDPDGNVIRREVRGNAGGELVGNRLQALRRVHYRYDELGRLIAADREIIVPVAPTSGATVQDGAASPGDGRITTLFEWDANSRQTHRVEDDLATYTAIYDGANRRVEHQLPLPGTNVTFAWDLNDRLVETVETHTNPDGLQPPAVLRTTYVRDALNRVERVTDAKDQTTYYEYDSRNLVIARYDARGALNGTNDRGNPVRYLYDGIGRRWATTTELRQNGDGASPLDTSNPFNPDALIALGWVWDGNGRNVGRTDDNGKQTSYAYDQLDRRIQRTNADGGTITWSYNTDHRATRVVDENGTVHDYTYDKLDRLRTRTFTTTKAFLVGTTSQTFDWDGLSRLVRCTDNNDPGDGGDDSVVECRYDSLGRLLEEIQNGRAVGSSFDADDKTACLYPGGRTITYMYDAHDQLRRVSDALVEIEKHYLGACPATILEEWSRPGAGAIAERRQTLDAKKLVMAITYVDAADQTTGTIDLARNRADDVESANIAIPPGTGGFGGMGMGGRQEAMPLDSRGRLRMQNNSTPGEIVSIGTNVDLLYGGAQELRRTVTNPGNIVRDHSFNSVYEDVARSYNDDAVGTGVRTADAAFRYLWDALGRLREVRRASDDGLVAEYTYDAHPSVRNGRRCTKTAGGETTTYVYDGMHVIQERDGTGGIAQEFIYGQGVDDILAKDDGEQVLSYLKDWNNNVRQIVDTTGQAVEVYAYDQHGFPMPAASTANNPYRFTGRRFDEETGLYYYRARYYDPVAGRFLSRDPLGAWGDASSDGNPYTYAGNNPWNRRDPSGLDPDSLWTYRSIEGDHLGELAVGCCSGGCAGGPKDTALRMSPTSVFFDRTINPRCPHGEDEDCPGQEPGGIRLDCGGSYCNTEPWVESDGPSLSLSMPFASVDWFSFRGSDVEVESTFSCATGDIDAYVLDSPWHVIGAGGSANDNETFAEVLPAGDYVVYVELYGVAPNHYDLTGELGFATPLWSGIGGISGRGGPRLTYIPNLFTSNVTVLELDGPPANQVGIILDADNAVSTFHPTRSR